jgi:hypothetical protein
LATTDLAYVALGAVRDAVDVIVAGGGAVWQPVTVVAPVSLAELADEYLGASDDDAIDRLLSANPNTIDLLAAPVGAVLWIPVI